MVMMMTMIPLTTVREFCFEFSLRESNERKTNQQDRFQHLFLSENASLLFFFRKQGDKSTELLSTSCFCKLLRLIKIKLLINLRTTTNNRMNFRKPSFFVTDKSLKANALYSESLNRGTCPHWGLEPD